MSDLSPLRRKIGATRPVDKPPPMTAVRVWRRAVAHALARAIEMEVTVPEVKLDTVLPEKIIENIDDTALCVLLDGADGYGLAILDVELASALLEQQALGRVNTRPAEPREMTNTDSAMVADPLDRVLATHEALVAQVDSGAVAGGYRFATRIEELREIALSLGDDTHDRATLTVRFTGTERSGTLAIILPRPAAVTTEDGDMVDWGSRLESRVLGSEVQLNAHLADLRLSVQEVTQFVAGQVLVLPRKTLGEVRLRDPKGTIIAHGKLGQAGGRKAVRLSDGEAIEEPAADPPLLGVEGMEVDIDIG